MSASPQLGASALIVVPTFDEAANLPRLLDAIAAIAPAAHVLVVDDGSPDGTGSIAAARSAADPRVHVLLRSGKQGLGTAYVDGFRWGLARGYALLLEMDADLSHQPAHLPALLTAAQRYDAVVGSRYIPGGRTIGWPRHRRLLSRGANLYARVALGLPYADVTGGFRCFRADAVRRIELGAIRSRGYGFQVELLYRLHAAGCSVGEVPITFPQRTDGASKMSGAIMSEALFNVWRLRGAPR